MLHIYENLYSLVLTMIQMLIHEDQVTARHVPRAALLSEEFCKPQQSLKSDTQS